MSREGGKRELGKKLKGVDADIKRRLRWRKGAGHIQLEGAKSNHTTSLGKRETTKTGKTSGRDSPNFAPMRD